MKITKSISKITAVLLLCFFAFALVSCDTGTFQGKEAIPLSAPVNLKVSDSTLTWNPVENAIGYTVKIQQGKNASADAIGDEIMVSTNSYSLEALREGDYTISVKSRGDTVLYSSSNYSSSIQYTRKSDSGLEYEDVVSGAFGSFDEINTRESYLGYGIDIINATGVTSKNIKTTYPIFSKDAILNETLLKSNEHYSNLYTIEAKTMEKFINEMSVSTSVSVGSSVSASGKIEGADLGGSVALSAGISNTFKHTHEGTYKQHFLEIIAENQNYTLMLQTQESRYKEILSEEFKKDLYDPAISPARLFEKYGTHLLTSVTMGGNISMYYTMYSLDESTKDEHFNEISTSLKQSADIVYSGINIGGSSENSFENTFNYLSIAQKHNIQVEKLITTAGGSGDFGITTEASLFKNYADWQKSLDSYPVVIGIKDSNSLYPIWDLIDPSLDSNTYTWTDKNGDLRTGTRVTQLYSYFQDHGAISLENLYNSYDIQPPVAPTEITNIQIKTNSDYQEGDLVQIKAGDTFQIKFDVLPDTANKYKKTFSVDSEYVTIDGSGNVTVSPDIPNNLPVIFTITAGTIERKITCQVIMTYNVIFNTVVSDLTVPPINGVSGATAIKEPILEREGYILEGWYKEYKDGEYTEKFDFDNELVTSNLVLHAKWIRIKPVITFNTNGGSKIDSQTIAYNSTAEQPNEPTMDGYSFVGWYSDKELTEKFDFATNIKSNITLYAKWDKIIFTVMFEANGGTPVSAQSTDVLKNYLIIEPECTRAYYTLIGWYRDSSCSQRFHFGEAITEDLTLYAKWAEKDITVTFIDRDANEIIHTATTNISSGFKITAIPALTKEGHVLHGWILFQNSFTSEELLSYEFNDENLSYELYPHWVSENATPYTLTVNYVYKDGSTAAPSKIHNFYEYEPYNVESPQIQGFTPDNAVISGEMPKNNVTKTVTYSPNTYTVTVSFDFYDGKGEQVKTIVKEYQHQKSYEITIPQIEGYNTESTTISGTVNAADVSYKVTYHPNTYTVIFHENTGNDQTREQEFAYNASENLDANSFTVDGYKFCGWTTGYDGSGSFYENGALVNNLATANGAKVHLFAEWDLIQYIYLDGATVDGKSYITYTKCRKQNVIELIPDEKPNNVFFEWRLVGEGYYVTLNQNSKGVGELTIPAETYGNIYIEADWALISHTHVITDTLIIKEKTDKDEGHTEHFPDVFDIEKLTELGYTSFQVSLSCEVNNVSGKWQYFDFFYGKDYEITRGDKEKGDPIQTEAGVWTTIEIIDHKVEDGNWYLIIRPFSDFGDGGSFDLHFGYWDGMQYGDNTTNKEEYFEIRNIKITLLAAGKN